jgi:hypothetical protein
MAGQHGDSHRVIAGILTSKSTDVGMGIYRQDRQIIAVAGQLGEWGHAHRSTADATASLRRANIKRERRGNASHAGVPAHCHRGHTSRNVDMSSLLPANMSRPSSAIVSLPGRGRADVPFDHFHTVLAEVVQRPVLVVGEQLHDPVGMLLAGGIEKEEGTACPGVA